MKNCTAVLVFGAFTLFVSTLGFAEIPEQNQLNIKDLKITTTTYNSFSVKADFEGDVNSNAACTLFYCNHTQDTKCVPLKSDHAAMLRGEKAFTATVTDLDKLNNQGIEQYDSEGYTIEAAPPKRNEPSDQFYIEMSCQDADGVKKARSRGNLILAPDPEFVLPSWYQEVVANVEYGMGRRLWPVKENRTAEDMSYFTINKDGKIHGDEIYHSGAFASFSDFRSSLLGQTGMLQALLQGKMPMEAMGSVQIPTANQPSLQDLKIQYKAYLKQHLDYAVAGLALGRILDNEAMKRKMAPTVSKGRFDYVLNYVLNKNAVEKNLISADKPTDTNYPRMFEWLKSTVKEQGSYVLALDWKPQPWINSLDQDLLKASSEMVWPEVSLELTAEGFPETLAEFQDYMLNRLDEMYRSVLRINLWQVLRQERRTDADSGINVKSNKPELRRYYEELKEKAFKTRESSLSSWEFTASGPETEKFLQRFAQYFGEYELEVLAKIRKLKSNDQVQELLNSVRADAAYKMFEKTQAEFTDAINASRLKVSLFPRYGGHDGIDPLDATDVDQAEKLRFLYADPMLDQMMNRQIFPRYEAVLKDGSVQVVFVSSLVRGDAFYAPFEHPKVQAILKKYASEKKAGKILRDLTYQLFEQNPLKVAYDTCNSGYWSCIETDPVKLTQALFPEVPFSGADMKGKTSSLQDPTLFDNVMMIDSQPFTMAMEFPNFKDRTNKSFKFSDQVRSKHGSGVKLKGLGLEY